MWFPEHMKSIIKKHILFSEYIPTRPPPPRLRLRLLPLRTATATTSTTATTTIQYFALWSFRFMCTIQYFALWCYQSVHTTLHPGNARRRSRAPKPPRLKSSCNSRTNIKWAVPILLKAYTGKEIVCL